MVKAVIGDELQLTSFEDRLSQSSIPVQVGIVVGKLSPTSDRGYVYALIPTPPTDSNAPACSLRSDPADKKRGSKGGAGGGKVSASALVIDADWVAEHARQVSRMLLGGMDVVGVYVWAPETPFKATPASLLSQGSERLWIFNWNCQSTRTSDGCLPKTVIGVARAAPWYESNFDERLLIHISYSPRRWSCRNCTLGSGSLRPCDFKLGKLFSSLQAFRCTYNFEIRVPISYAGSSGSNVFRNIVCNGIARHSKVLQRAKALINGKLIAEDQPSTSEGLHNVELLLPFMNDASIEANSLEEVSGIIVFSGTICAFAYLGPKEPVSQAISDLKGDIITSLRSRLDIISDEAEGEADTNVNIGEEARNEDEISAEKSIHRICMNKSRRHFLNSFPRRVLVPWVPGVFISDYLQQSETFEDVKERCKEMISLEAPIQTYAIVEPETETTMTMRSFWDVIHGGTSSPVVALRDGEHQAQEEVSAHLGRNKFSFVAAIIVLLVAIFGGLMITVFQPFGAPH